MMTLVTKDFRRTTLRPRHRPIVRALAQAFYSPNDEATPERLDTFVDEVDNFISPASKTLRFGLLMLLNVLQWSPLLFGKLGFFANLSIPDRVAHLERLERSKVRQLGMIVVAYKTVMTMLFYEDEAELAALGYPGAERKRYLNIAPAAARSSVKEVSP